MNSISALGAVFEVLMGDFGFDTISGQQEIAAGWEAARAMLQLAAFSRLIVQKPRPIRHSQTAFIVGCICTHSAKSCQQVLENAAMLVTIAGPLSINVALNSTQCSRLCNKSHGIYSHLNCKHCTLEICD